MGLREEIEAAFGEAAGERGVRLLAIGRRAGGPRRGRRGERAGRRPRRPLLIHLGD